MHPLIARLLLALAIVLFQHGAVAHGVGHFEDLQGAQHEPDGDTHAPHGCDACHAYAAADGGGAPAAGGLSFAPRRIESTPAAAHALPSAPPFHPFDSRAPPARS